LAERLLLAFIRQMLQIVLMVALRLPSLRMPRFMVVLEYMHMRGSRSKDVSLARGLGRRKPCRLRGFTGYNVWNYSWYMFHFSCEGGRRRHHKREVSWLRR
jgi:hypothetical protein